MEENSKLLLLEQQFKNYVEVSKKQIDELTKKTEDQEKRIITLEKNNTKTDLQYNQIMQTLNKLNDITIPNLTDQVEELKNKPAKRYDQVITGIIAAFVGGIMGFIINQFFGGK